MDCTQVYRPRPCVANRLATTSGRRGPIGSTLRSGPAICSLRPHLQAPAAAKPGTNELRRRRRPNLRPRIRQVVLHRRVRQAEPVGGRLLGPGGGARESVWIGPARRHAGKGGGGGPRFLVGRLGHAVGPRIADRFAASQAAELSVPGGHPARASARALFGSRRTSVGATSWRRRPCRRRCRHTRRRAPGRARHRRRDGRAP